MVANRKTTINHMFAAAIAPHDAYDEARVREAVSLLGNDPDGDLACAYCSQPAETWDHIHATVKDSAFSGHGHRLGNLLPCCKACNSKKGNKPWQVHLKTLGLGTQEQDRRESLISGYIAAYAAIDSSADTTPDRQRLDAIRAQILSLMADADKIADRVRAQATSAD